jgi:hypothetical protein
MLARGRLIGRLMLFATAIGNLLGVLLALLAYAYYPSAAIIAVVLLSILLYLPIAVSRWLKVFERNELAQQAMQEELLSSGRTEAEAEVHVHTERLLVRAKLPVTRFTIIWPLLTAIFPLTIAAAAIESWMYASSGVDSALNKLLLVLMAASIRSVFQTVNIFESTAVLTARAVRPDALDSDEEDV